MRTSRKARRAARQLFRLCIVAGTLDERRVRHVARRIARSGRRGALELLAGFRRLVRLDHDRRTALVESASPLARDVRQHIQADLLRLYGPGLKTSFDRNPDLIGGLRIRVGSDVYDDSVRARLAALAARL